MMMIKDVALVAEECPNLRNIQLYLFGDDPYLEDEDTDVWAPFARLDRLRQLHLIAHQGLELDGRVAVSSLELLLF